MENKIAVIIPAYKDTYLLNTLISINNQTDKKFNLYIYATIVALTILKKY